MVEALGTHPNRLVLPLDVTDEAQEVRAVAANLNHGQPGDPDKLARVLVDFADAPNPPVRMALGSDTVEAIRAKHESDSSLLAAWHAVSVSTDF